MMGSVSEGVENIIGKRENAGHPKVFIMFSKAVFVFGLFLLLKSRIAWYS